MGFGQVANWGQVTVDTIAETKKVVWRPVTSTTVLLVGQPVCYNSDATADWKENASNRISNDFGAEDVTAYAEGSQNYNARLLVVEEPLTANLMSFAGVVKSLGPKRGADGDTIEIYVPKEGAVVPAYLAASVTTNASVVGIVNAGASLISGGRPIGIAMETIDRSSTNGLAWIKFQSFAYQAGTTSTLLTGVVLNTYQHSSINTSGSFCNMLVHSTCSGTLAAAHNEWGILDYLNISGSITAAGYTRALLAQLNLAGTINHAGSHQYAVMAQLTGTPTFTANQRCAGLSVDLSLGSNPTSGVYDGILIANNGANQTQVDHAIEIFGNYGINYLFSFQSCDGITGNFISNGGTGGAEIGITSGGDWKKVKVNLEGTDYFLILMVNPSEVDMVS